MDPSVVTLVQKQIQGISNIMFQWDSYFMKFYSNKTKKVINQRAF